MGKERETRRKEASVSSISFFFLFSRQQSLLSLAFFHYAFPSTLRSSPLLSPFSTNSIAPRATPPEIPESTHLQRRMPAQG